MSMAFVSFTEFQVRYENTIPAADEERVAAYLEDACALVTDILGATVTAAYGDGSGESVPGGIVAAVCNAVRRAYDNPNGLQGETIGDYSWRSGYTGVSASANIGVYFTPAEVRQIRRAAGLSALATIDLQGMLPDAISAEQYVADAGSPWSPILYYAQEDLEG